MTLSKEEINRRTEAKLAEAEKREEERLKKEQEHRISRREKILHSLSKTQIEAIASLCFVECDQEWAIRDPELGPMLFYDDKGKYVGWKPTFRDRWPNIEINFEIVGQVPYIEEIDTNASDFKIREQTRIKKIQDSILNGIRTKLKISETFIEIFKEKFFTFTQADLENCLIEGHDQGLWRSTGQTESPLWEAMMAEQDDVYYTRRFSF